VVQNLNCTLIRCSAHFILYPYKRSSMSASTNEYVKPPPDTTPQPPKCRYRLDTEGSSTLTLPDGRNIGFAEYGSRTGHAILYLHSLPGSRLEAASYHSLTLSLQVRIIAIDRPGMGWSSPCPQRTLLDFPKDVQHLTENLHLEPLAPPCACPPGLRLQILTSAYTCRPQRRAVLDHLHGQCKGLRKGCRCLVTRRRSLRHRTKPLTDNYTRYRWIDIVDCKQVIPATLVHGCIQL
jgi:hypothetical protein